MNALDEVPVSAPGRITRARDGRPYILADPTWLPEDYPDRKFTNKDVETRGPSALYSRFSTFAGALEDTYALGLWQQRQVIMGLSLRRSLVERAQAIDYEKDSPEYIKGELDAIAREASEAADSHGAATRGTAFHRVTQIYDSTGRPPANISPLFMRALAAYLVQTRHWDYFAIEQFMVNDKYGCAGTPDRLRMVELSEDGEPLLLRVTDIKTGSIEFPQKFSVQCALAALGALYDVDTGVRTRVPIDLKTAEIVQVDIDAGSCSVVPIDIEQAVKAIQLAVDVRAWRAAKLLGPAYLFTSTGDTATRAAWSGEVPNQI